MRDLRGEEIPVGKVHRRLRFDGLAADAAPDWLDVTGAGSVTKSDVAEGRGELDFSATDGVGTLTGPAFDPTAFRELRFRVAFDHDVSDDGVLRFGFAESDETGERSSSDQRQPSAWCEYRENGESEHDRGGRVSDGVLSFGRHGEETDRTGDLAIFLDASGGATLAEIRVRPFESGVTLLAGGAGRGDTIYEDRDCPFGFDEPVRPRIALDSTESAETETLSISAIEIGALHN
jgi:hypothetical protein